MVGLFNEILATRLEPVYQLARAGGVNHLLADITAAGHLLSYKPRVCSAEGLRKTVEWYRWAIETG